MVEIIDDGDGFFSVAYGYNRQNGSEDFFLHHLAVKGRILDYSGGEKLFLFIAVLQTTKHNFPFVGRLENCLDAVEMSFVDDASVRFVVFLALGVKILHNFGQLRIKRPFLILKHRRVEGNKAVGVGVHVKTVYLLCEEAHNPEQGIFGHN